MKEIKKGARFFETQCNSKYCNKIWQFIKYSLLFVT